MNDAQFPETKFPDEIRHAAVPDFLKVPDTGARLVPKDQVKIPDLPADKKTAAPAPATAAASAAKTALLIFAFFLFSFAFGARAATFTITNDTAYTTAVGMYVSNSTQNFTFQTPTNLAPGVSNVISYTGATGVYTTTTNQTSWLASIGYLTPFGQLANTNGANLSLVNSNVLSQAGIGAIAPSASTPASTPVQTVIPYLTGYYAAVISTNPVPNTNQIYVTGAGSNQANGEYIFSQGNFGAGGWIYSNFTANGYICKQLGGNQTGNNDQHPFWMGPTTNNVCLDSAPIPSCWYFSSADAIHYYTNADDNNQSSGTLPLPTLVYGTNYAVTTNYVFECPSWYGSQYSNGVVYVATNGSDVLASNLVCSFATLQAAKRFAQPGQTIEVLPGWYEDHDLLKNGVNWHFEKGATLAWDESQFLATTPRGIFDDYAGAVTSSITCDRLHFTTIQPVITSAIIFTNPADRVEIEFANDVDCGFYTIGNGAQSFPGYPNTPTTTGNIVRNGYLCEEDNCSFVSLKFDGMVSCGTNTTRQYLDSDDDDFTYGTYVARNPNSMGFEWNQGEEHINGHNFSLTNADSLFGNGPQQTPIFLWCLNGGTAETSLYVTADFVGGHVYDDSSNPNARVWYNIDFLNGDQNALRLYGNDLIYYNGQKMANNGSGRDVIDNSSGNGKLWLTLQKMTQNSSGGWINFNANWENFISVQQFEDNSGSTMTRGLFFQTATTTNFFYGGYAAMTNHPPVQFGAGGVSVVGPPTSFEGFTAQGMGTNAAIWMVNFTNNLTLQGCNLHTVAALGSIYSLVPAWVSGSFMADIPPTNNIKMNGTNYIHIQTSL